MRTPFFLFFIVLNTFLISTQSIHAQDKKKIRRDAKNLSFFNAIIEKNDKTFDAVIAPEEWHDESYVILANFIYLNVGSEKRKLRGVHRKRILLQDKNAVEFFTEFYFQDSETNLITLTKKSGEEIEISTKDAIKATTEVPAVYRSRFQSSQSYKLAIPNMEIGDVVDFTTIYSQDFGDKISYVDVLSESQPILYQNIIMDVDRQWDIYLNTFNTNDKFDIKKQKGHNYDGEPDKSMNRYLLVNNKLEARAKEMWDNVYAKEPIIKFQGIAPQEKHFYKGLDKEKSSINVESVLKGLIQESYASKSYFKELTYNVLLKVKGVTSKKDSPNVKALACYYYLREAITEKYQANVVVSSVKYNQTTYEAIYDSFSSLDEINFFNLFITLLRSLDVDAQVVAILPNSQGSLKDVVSINEMYYGVRLAESNLYFWPLNRNSTHLDMPTELMSGGKGYYMNDKPKMTDSDKAYSLTLEPVKASSNTEKNTLFLTLNLADNLTTITKSVTASGFQKRNYKGFIEDFGEELYKDFLSMYDDHNTKYYLEGYNKSLEKDKKGVYKDFVQKSDKKMSDAFKNWVEEKDAQTKVITYETKTSGRTSVNPELSAEVTYTSDGFMKKLGPNYVFEIGKIIGSQIFVDEKERTGRKNDILMGLPRVYDYTMELTIPEGFFVENIDGLNKSATNEYCSFISTAQQEGNVIKITSIKSYEKTAAPLSAWQDIINVMDEASKFSNEKIIIKKR